MLDRYNIGMSGEKGPKEPKKPESVKPESGSKVPESKEVKSKEKKEKKEKKQKPNLVEVVKKLKSVLTKAGKELDEHPGFSSRSVAEEWFEKVIKSIDTSALSRGEYLDFDKEIQRSGLKKKAVAKILRTELPDDPEARRAYLEGEAMKVDPNSQKLVEFLGGLSPDLTKEERETHVTTWFLENQDVFEDSVNDQMRQSLNIIDDVDELRRGGFGGGGGGDEGPPVDGEDESFGSYSEWFSSLVEKDRAYPFGPETILLDARREIAEIAVNRAKDREDVIQVTETDVHDWIMHKMEDIIRTSEEGTSQAVQGHLQPIFAVLAAKDLKMKEIFKDISNMPDEQVRQLELRGVRGLRKLKDKLSGKTITWEDEEHVSSVSQKEREETASSLTMISAGIAYGHSTLSSFEPLMRRLTPAEIGHVLELVGRKTRIKGGLGFYRVKTEKTWTRRWLGDKLKSLGKGSEVVKMDGDTKTEMIAEEMVLKVDGKKVASMESLESMLEIEDEIAMRVHTYFNQQNQERNFQRIMHRNDEMADHGRYELTRQAILMEMGVVDLDGRVNFKKIKELAAEKEGKDVGDIKIGFEGKISDAEITEEDFRSRKGNELRAQLVVEEYEEEFEETKRVIKEGEKPSGELLQGYIIVGEGDDREVKSIDKVEGKTEKDADFFRVKGWDEHKLAWEEKTEELDGVFLWARSLSESSWRVLGLASAQDKDFGGNTLDWHTKILQLPRYSKMYGIGATFLREVVSTEYRDFITMRLGELFGKDHQADKDMFEKVLKDEVWGLIGKKQKQKDRKNLINEALGLLVVDYNGFFMSRDRIFKLFEVYEGIKEKQNEAAADEFMRDRLVSQFSYKYGRPHGEMRANKVFQNIKELDYSKKLGKETDGLTDDEKTGFEGLFRMIKLKYDYKDFGWGKTWGERPFKEAQYTVAADGVRGAMLGWITGQGPKKLENLVGVVKAAAWYGVKDTNYKIKMLTKRVAKYFSNSGPVGMRVPKRDKDSWSSVEREKNWFDVDPENEFIDPIDGTLDKNYETERAWLRTPAEQDYHDPEQSRMTVDDKRWMINKITGEMLLKNKRDYNELMSEATGLGEWLQYQPSMLSERMTRRIENKHVRAILKPVLSGLVFQSWLFGRHEIDLPGGKVVQMSNVELIWKRLRLVGSAAWSHKWVLLLGLTHSVLGELKKQIEEAFA